MQRDQKRVASTEIWHERLMRHQQRYEDGWYFQEYLTVYKKFDNCLGVMIAKHRAGYGAGTGVGGIVKAYGRRKVRGKTGLNGAGA